MSGISPGGIGFMALAGACRCAVWLFSTTLLWVFQGAPWVDL
jgi:hypothetical protein